MRVSVIIPTFNREDLVCRALRSVLGQTRPPDEVIVVDDGSTDDTVHRIQSEFSSVRCVRQARRGVSAARNHGIAESSGDWLAFLDSDDEWRPRKLERQCDELARHPGYLICHSDEVWIRRGIRVNPRERHAKAGGDIFERCLPMCAISPSSVMIARVIFCEIGVFDENLPACEDYDLWLRVCSRHPVLYVSEPLVVKYGGHSDQLSRAHWGMDRFRIAALEKILGSGTLSPAHERAARRTLLQKIDVYLQGAKKRGKYEDVDEYERKRAAYVVRLPGDGVELP